jgi:WD40 repeat protein
MALAFSANGRHLTTRDSTGMVRVWDWRGSKEVARIASRGADAPSHGYDDYNVDDFLAHSPDGKTLMFAGLSSVLQFVDLATAKELFPAAGHKTPIMSVRFTPDGKQVLAQDSDWSVHRWAVDSSRDLGAAKQPSTSRVPTLISPDGRVGVEMPGVGGGGFAPFGVAAGGPGVAKAKGAQDLNAVLFDPDSAMEVGKIVFKPQNISALFSPDSKLLAVYCATEQKIQLHEVATAKLLHTFEGLPGPPVAKGGFGAAGAFAGPGGFGGLASQQTMFFSPDGAMLAFYWSRGQTTVYLFDTASGKQIGSMPIADASPSTSGAFSADNRCLALDMSDGTVVLYELSSSQVRRTYGTKQPEPAKGAKAVPAAMLLVAGADRQRGGAWCRPRVPVPPGPSFALSRDGKSLARVGSDRGVHLLDIHSGRELAVFHGHGAPVNAVAFAPDGKSVVSGSTDTTALIWDVTDVNRLVPPTKALSTDDLQTCWQVLADNDAAKADSAMTDLVAAPKEAVVFVKQRLKPAPPFDFKGVEELISQLDSDQYKVREKATGDLFKIGDQIVATLDKALAANPSPETTKRLQVVRAKLTGLVLQGDRLRAFRAIEVMERIGTLEARQVLEALAAGAPESLLTKSAQAALKR